MSTMRLTFLYPHLLRAARGGAPSRGAYEFRSGHAGWVRRKSTFAPRVGKAVEPGVFEQQDQNDGPEGARAQTQPGAEKKDDTKQTTTLPQEEGVTADVGAEAAQAVGNGPEFTSPESIKARVSAAETKATQQATTEKASEAEQTKTDGSDGGPRANESTAVTTTQSGETAGNPGAEDKATKPGGPLEAVLHIQPPEVTPKRHPSMPTPPYVHHFDSYSLVKELETGGFSKGQATTAMKGIRKILAQNLDVAQASLVSKSDVENETYLFQAACSEMSTEIANNRRLRDEQSRQQRSHMQNEVDILTQSVNQELLTLNDDVRGMFNDRKMTVREEQNTVESAVQQINYKISILLSSDSKSEIEAVRWILIRRSVLGILFMAVLTLGTLRYATYVGQQRKLEAERRRREEEEQRRDGGRRDHSAAPDAAVILAAN